MPGPVARCTGWAINEILNVESQLSIRSGCHYVPLSVLISTTKSQPPSQCPLRQQPQPPPLPWHWWQSMALHWHPHHLLSVHHWPFKVHNNLTMRVGTPYPVGYIHIYTNPTDMWKWQVVLKLRWRLNCGECCNASKARKWAHTTNIYSSPCLTLKASHTKIKALKCKPLVDLSKNMYIAIHCSIRILEASLCGWQRWTSAL